MTITLDHFDTDTNPQNNRNISFIWKGKSKIRRKLPHQHLC